ncbi:MAG: hypothetical protein KAQ96_08255, partial [Thermoplasmata archaeon]|nr:hypothetical protein [Thermoplasmata archaeon]
SMALGSFSGGNKYVFINYQDQAIVDSPTIDEETTFYWIEVSEDYGGFKAGDGRSLTVDDRGFLVASPEGLDNKGYFEIDEVSSKKVLKAHNGKYLRVLGDGTVAADAATNTTQDLLQVMNEGVRAKSTTLAYYYEDFSITGIQSEEHLGTNAGVVYSENITEAIAANLNLAYDFLRNSTTTANDIAALLAEHDIYPDIDVSAFDTMEAASQGLMVELLAGMIDKIPEGELRPIITCMESTSKIIDAGGLLVEDLTEGLVHLNLSNAKAETLKLMRAVWYMNGSEVATSVEDAIGSLWEKGEEIWTDVTNIGKATIAALVTVWEAGESFITKIGDDFPDYLKFPETGDIGLVVGDIMQKGLNAISTLVTLIQGLKTAYDFLKTTKLAKLFTEPLSSIKALSSTFKSVTKINAGFMKAVNKIGKALKWIGLVVDIGIAIYCMFAIAESMGWSQTGIFIGVLYGVMMIAYAVIMIAIGFIPYVGWLISGLITLSDMIVGWIFGKGWTQMLMELIIDLVTDFNVLTEADIKINDSETIIDDIDDNGLDVGDHIEYKSD